MTLEETLICTFDEGYAKGEKSGTAAERKRILALLEKLAPHSGMNSGMKTFSMSLKFAIEHPEPDAGGTRAAQKV